MRIVYDNIIFGYQKSGGISVVWGELLRRALRDGLDLSFIEFTPTENLVRRELDIPRERIRSVPACLRKAFKYLPAHAAGKEPFIFHSSYFRTCLNPHAVNVTTVHDFTNERFQTGAGAGKERRIKHRAIRHSDWIICISEHTRQDFFLYFPDFPRERVTVIHNGVSGDFHPLDDPGELPFPKGSYLLFVGERDGYKHFDLVPEILRRSTLNLVFTGRPLSPREQDMLEGLEARCRYAGRVPVGTLNRLYNGAFALLYPSAYEGFGLPVLEAQRAGCPVIACNASSIPEIIGDGALLMERPAPEEALEGIGRLSDPAERERIIRAGLENARRFSWETMYQQVIALYKQAMRDGKRR